MLLVRANRITPPGKKSTTIRQTINSASRAGSMSPIRIPTDPAPADIPAPIAKRTRVIMSIGRNQLQAVFL